MALFRKSGRVIFTKDVSSSIGITVKPGNRGAILDNDPETGNLEILLDNVIPGLEHWRNIVTVSPDEYDKIKLEPSAWVSQLHGMAVAPATAMALLAVIAVFSLPQVTHALRGPPIAYRDITLAKSILHVGEPMKLHIHNKFLRACRWLWTRRFYPAGSSTEVAIADENTAVAAVGIPTDRVHGVPMPIMNPGHYTLKISGVASCDYGDTYTVEDKPLDFTVLANSEKAVAP